MRAGLLSKTLCFLLQTRQLLCKISFVSECVLILGQFLALCEELFLLKSETYTEKKSRLIMLSSHRVPPIPRSSSRSRVTTILGLRFHPAHPVIAAEYPTRLQAVARPGTLFVGIVVVAGLCRWQEAGNRRVRLERARCQQCVSLRRDISGMRSPVARFGVTTRTAYATWLDWLALGLENRTSRAGHNS